MYWTQTKPFMNKDNNSGSHGPETQERESSVLGNTKGGFMTLLVRPWNVLNAKKK